MRVSTALLLCFATCCGVAAQQAGQTQSTTTFQSNITGSATTVSPAKYYIGNIDLSKPAGDDKDTKQPAGCQPPSQKAKPKKAPAQESKLKFDLQYEAYLLGEAPVLVHATASDGCPVKLTITDGNDIIKLRSSSGSDGASDSNGPSPPADSCVSPCTVTFLQAGRARILAEEQAEAGIKPASPRFRWLTVEQNALACIPGLLPPNPPQKSKADGSSIVQYLGNPSPYSFQMAGEKLLVYSSKDLQDAKNKQALVKFRQQVQDLLSAVGNASPATGATAAPASTTSAATSTGGSSASGAPTVAKPAYSIEVSIPHYTALGDLAAKLNTVNYPDFTIQDVGSSKVRITSAAIPSCSELTAFLKNLRDVAWRPRPENPVAKLFFLNASDITGALGSSASAPASTASPAASSSSQTGSSAAGASAAGTGTGAAATTSATPSGSSTMPHTAAGPGSTTATTPSAGTGSSPASSAGATSGGSGGGGAAGATALAAGGTTPGAAASPAPPTVSGVGMDTLLFQDAVPGDDAAVAERKRLVALLDLPRPQMIINVWTLQASSTNKEAVSDATRGLHQLVDNYNLLIQQTIERGWEYLRFSVSQPGYFDVGFYTYLTGRYVQDPVALHDALKRNPDVELKPEEVAPRILELQNERLVPSGLEPQAIAQRVLTRQTGTPMNPDLRNQWGVCPADKYCLGYTNIFQPLKPRLTDLLVATIASKTPLETMNTAINVMEEGNPWFPVDKADKADWERKDCAQKDLDGDKRQHFYLECFREVATVQFSPGGIHPYLKSQPAPLGLLRAAVADFLFEYKLSQMFPHEFDDYKLSQSAQTLNAALAPLVEAFNRDVTTFQGAFSDRVMNPRKDPGIAEWFGSERPKLVNNGMISVRTISGFESTVNTTSQNFLDATQMPTLSALVQSITSAAPSTSGKPNVLQNISPIQAQVIMGALAAYQSSQVQIGRTFNIDVAPRSLNRASSAEITVKINADESASPTYYSPTASSTSANISRVASHDTTTRVRVDSIKLFDVSTFTAVLQKSRTRFPLLPPLVEIPYVGTLIGVPLPVAKEFHSSMAVLSSFIVPTAADIALGFSFDSDRLVDSDGADACSWPGLDGKWPDPVPNVHLPRCKLRQATFLSDLDSSAIRRYHSRMISCLANSMQADFPMFDQNYLPVMGSKDDCDKLSLTGQP